MEKPKNLMIINFIIKEYFIVINFISFVNFKLVLVIKKFAIINFFYGDIILSIITISPISLKVLLKLMKHIN